MPGAQEIQRLYRGGLKRQRDAVIVAGDAGDAGDGVCGSCGGAVRLVPYKRARTMFWNDGRVPVSEQVPRLDRHRFGGEKVPRTESWNVCVGAWGIPVRIVGDVK